MPLRIHLREAEPPREGQVLSKLSEDDSPGPSGHRVCNGVNILSNDGKFGVVEPLLILLLSPLMEIGMEGGPTKGRS